MNEAAPRVLVVAVAPCVDRYAWFDDFRIGVPNRPSRVVVRPGGKAMNASRVMTTLGVAVAVVAPLDPSEGGWWVARSIDEGIRVTPCPAVGPTRMSLTCIDEGAQRATKIYEPAGTLASAEWAGLAAAVAAALTERPRPRAVAIVGSRPGPDDGTLATIVASCRDAGVPVYLDGHGPAVLEALRAQPTVIKVNLEEARSLLAAEVDADAAAVRIATMGQGIAIVTVGADGAVCFDGERLRRIPGSDATRAIPRWLGRRLPRRTHRRACGRSDAGRGTRPGTAMRGRERNLPVCGLGPAGYRAHRTRLTDAAHPGPDLTSQDTARRCRAACVAYCCLAACLSRKWPPPNRRPRNTIA